MIRVTVLAGCAAGLVASAASRAQPLVCIAEGTPADRVTARIAAAAQAGPQAANVAERWTRTATNGSGIGRGEPVTLTWSVVPDGTGIDDVLSDESADVSDLEAFLTANFGAEPIWLGLIQAALDGWSGGPGMTFVYEPNDDGRVLSGGKGVLGVRADIRIGGHDIDGDFGTVAYGFFPNGGGDMVIDTHDSFNATTASFQNVVAHEGGHAIGLGHTCPVDQSKLMEPVITAGFSGPQFDDLLGAHRNYGDVEEENDVVGEAADLGLAIDTTTQVDRLALDGNGDHDWFVVPPGSLTEVTLDLDPAGTIYDFGSTSLEDCEGVSTSPFDPTRVQDMSVAVIDFDGTTILASADATAAGGSESLSDVRLSKLGGFIRIRGAGIDDAQVYELGVILVPEPAPSLLRATALVGLALLARRQRAATARPRSHQRR